MNELNSTRVQAPASLPSSDSGSAFPRNARMTAGAESSHGEGTGLIRPRGGRHLILPDLRVKHRVGTWNVLTLSHDGYAMALSRELNRYKIVMAGLTETRLMGSGSERYDGYTLLHSGGDRRHRGVGLMLDRCFNAALMGWQPISDRLLVARLKHQHGACSIVVVYAPTDEADTDVKDVFYDQLQSVMDQIPRRDQKIVLGDFNAVTGTDRRGYEDYIGWYGSGESNDNSERFKAFNCANGLVMTGSWFRRLNIHRMTWLSNDGVTKKEIDHILVSERSMVSSYRVFRGAEAPANTDHRLVIADISLRVKRVMQRRPQKLDVRLLNEREASRTSQNYVQELRRSLSDFCSDEWPDVKVLINGAARKTVPPVKHKKRPWLSDETFAVLEAKRAARLTGNLVECRRLRNIFKAKAKRDMEMWYTSIADKTEEAARQGNYRDVYSAIRSLRGTESHSPSATICRTDGTFCTDKEEELELWCEHFRPLLNRPAAAPCDDLDEMALAGITDSNISTDPPNRAEIRSAIRHLKNGKAPGEDGIYPEFLKGAEEEIVEILTPLFQRVWTSGIIPSEWRESVVIPLYKGKGSRSSCDNYRPISLLSVPGKVFAAILLSRIKPLLLRSRRPNQSGFAPGRSTTDAILALRLLAEVHREFNRPLYVAYLDIKAAFDSADREALWKWLTGIGTPTVILGLVRQLYSDTTARVQVGPTLSTPFGTTTGVRQGCVIAPWLFCGPIDWTMARTCQHGGVKIGPYVFTDLVYADDAAIFSDSEERLPRVLDRFQREAATVGLRPSWTKSKVQNIAAGTSPTAIEIGDDCVESVESFTYLGSSVHSSGYCSHDLRRRIGLAGSVFNQLRRVWRQSRLTLATKLKVFTSCVISVLLYGCETWTLLKADRRKLSAFHMNCQRRILGVRWYERVTNAEIARRTGQPDIIHSIIVRQHSLFGHVRRMDEGAPAHKALEVSVRLSGGWRPDHTWRRPRGRPRLTWLRQMLSYLGLTAQEAWDAAADRNRWRALRPTQVTRQE